MKISLPPKAKPAENPRQPGASGRGSAAGAGHRLARDSEATRSNILDIATQEFAEHGFSGARIDVISDKTRTSKQRCQLNLPRWSSKTHRQAHATALDQAL